ncbi:MAG TPA: DUF805 domain-containing protein [Asticcacaulis sp.]|nr:DUF805 domain-containing protein [Asticcacaulis sp.]
MTFGEAIKSVYGKYATFSGRSRRSEYWFFQLFFIIVYFFAMLAAAFMPNNPDGTPGALTMGIFGLFALFVFGSLIPLLSLAVRRLHDSNHSGWWLLISFVPFVGGILLLIWYCTPGTTGPNKYGADPKATPANAASVF